MFTNKPPFSVFLESIPDIEILEKYAKPLNTIAGVTLENLVFLPYRILKSTVPGLMEAGEFERAIFEIVAVKKKNLKFKDIEKSDNYEKLRFIFWIRREYEKIRELEETHLRSEPDAKLVNAGIKELDILGDINLIDSLAGGDVLKWEEVRKLPYETIFNKQLKNTIEARINKRLAKQQSQKVK